MNTVALQLIRRLAAAALILSTQAPNAAHAHAFPDHADPRVGSAVTSPQAVRIWFDGALEPAFSSIAVKDAGGKRIDKGDGGVDRGSSGLLRVSLPPLKPGTYRVFWSAVGRDGHRTSGDYQFTVK